jgi:hypothetical protein
MHDEDGDEIGRVYTVSEVCDDLLRQWGRK